MSGNEMSRRSALRLSVTAVAAAGLAQVRLAGPATAGGPPLNVRVSHDDFIMHGEPSLAASPRHPGNLLGVCMVIEAGQTTTVLATYASFDGGASWRSNGVLPGIPSSGIDPTVAFDRSGTGFVCGAVGGATQPEAAGVYVWRTADGGRNFQPPVIAMPGKLDHPSLAIAPVVGRAPGTICIAAALDPGLVFTRSSDAGRTFAPARLLDPRGAPPVTACGPHGTVVISYPAFAGSPSSGVASVRAVVSTDHGTTFGPPAQLATTSTRPYYNLPAVAVSPPDGDIYIAVADYDPSSHRSRLELYRSGNHGYTWDPPATLATSSQTVYLQPGLAINDTGEIAVTAFASTGGLIDELLFRLRPGTSSSGSLRVTTQPFRASLGLGGSWIGDYQGLAVSRSGIHPFWNDTRTGRLEIFTARIPYQQ